MRALERLLERSRLQVHLNLKTKFALLAGTMVLVVAMLLTVFLTRQQERTIRGELLNRAVALTEQLAYNCQLPLAAENETSLRRLAAGLFEQPEVVFVQFRSASGKVLLREGDEAGLAGLAGGRDEAAGADLRGDSTAAQEGPSKARTAWIRASDGREFLDVQTEVRVESGDGEDILATRRRKQDSLLGEVSVGFSTAPAQAQIAGAKQLGALLGLAVAIAGSLVAAALVHVLTRPLSQLMEGNRRVARGDFGLRLEVRSGDEFGRLAGSYNQMADEIQRSRELAESYLASLRSNAEHLEEANRALQQSNAELAKASRMKSEFLAVMSHELRTPLNVIIGFSEVLQDSARGSLDAQRLRYIENIHTSGRHLLSLINDILDLSKVEAGRMQLAPEPFDLRVTLEEIQSLVRDLATKKGVEVRGMPGPTLTPVTDQKVFKQVMFNLLSNAIKFTPAGGKVDFSVRCLDGRALRDDPVTRPLPPQRRLAIVPRRVLLVEVRDTGVGIAAEDHEKIFQAFQQVDGSYSRRQEGTGLGLALTRKLVHLLRGDVWFASAAQEGSTFWFYVPFELGETEHGGGPDAETSVFSAGGRRADGAGAEADTATRAGGRAADGGVAPWTGHRPQRTARAGAESPVLWPWGNGGLPESSEGPAANPPAAATTPAAPVADSAAPPAAAGTPPAAASRAAGRRAGAPGARSSRRTKER